MYRVWQKHTQKIRMCREMLIKPEESSRAHPVIELKTGGMCLKNNACWLYLRNIISRFVASLLSAAIVIVIRRSPIMQACRLSCAHYIVSKAHSMHSAKLHPCEQMDFAFIISYIPWIQPAGVFTLCVIVIK